MFPNVDCPSDAEMFPNVDCPSDAEMSAAFEAMKLTLELGDATFPFEDPESYYAQSPYDFEMASPSSEKITERQQHPQGGAAAQQINKGKDDLHVALPADLIEKLKGAQNWGDRFRWTYDQEKVRRVWEIQKSMDFGDLIRHVMYGDGTEVVWEHDIWNLQHIVQPQAAKCTAKKDDNSADGDDAGGGEDDEERPSPMADKPDKDTD